MRGLGGREAVPSNGRGGPFLPGHRHTIPPIPARNSPPSAHPPPPNAAKAAPAWPFLSRRAPRGSRESLAADPPARGNAASPRRPTSRGRPIGRASPPAEKDPPQNVPL